MERVGKIDTIVTGVIIRNFKSIENVEFDLYPGVNVLVGANASGKTNVLEAISFLYKALIEAAERVPYRSHVPYYWDARDLIYMRDPSRHVEIGVKAKYYWRYGKRGAYVSDIRFITRFAFNASEETLEPVEYVVDIDDIEFIIGREFLSIKHPLESIKALKDYLEENKRIMKELLPPFFNNTRGSRRDIRLRDWLLAYLENFRVVNNYAIHRIELRHAILKPFIPWKPPILSLRSDFRVQRKLIIVLEYMNMLSSPIAYILKPKKTRLRQAEINPKASSREVPYLSWVLSRVIPFIIENIVFSRHPDIGVIRQPIDFRGSRRLRERAENLSEVLMTLQAKHGTLPDLIRDALSRCFPGMAIRLEPGLGKVALIGEEDGLRLNPPNLPDGLIKLVALMTAASLNPSILLVDEVENSMHARLLECVVDSFNSLDFPVLVATHSPIVVDLVDPKRVLIAVKQGVEGTRLERVALRRDLKERLSKLGVSLSDYVMYYLTGEG